MVFRMVSKSGLIFSSVLSQFTRLTDRQTELSLLDRVCIPSSAVKTIITITELVNQSQNSSSQQESVSTIFI